MELKDVETKFEQKCEEVKDNPKYKFAFINK